MVKAYIRAIAQISRLFALIATVLIIAAMLVVCQMILMRYVFAWATIWQTDFVVFAATGAIFLGAPYVLLVGGHVGVDVVEMLLGPRTRTGLRFVGSLFGLLFCVIMFVAGSIQFHDAWAGNWKHSSVWAPPLWVPLLALPIGFGLLCLQYVAKILAILTGEVEAEADKSATPEKQASAAKSQPTHVTAPKETMR